MKIKNNQKILIYSLGINSYLLNIFLKFILDKFKDHNLFLLSDSRLNIKNKNIIDNQYFLKIIYIRFYILISFMIKIILIIFFCKWSPSII